MICNSIQKTVLIVCCGFLAACGGAQTPGPQTGVSESARPAASHVAGSGHRYDLERDETRGGHTLDRHVGRSDDELRERLAQEPNISAASTWTNREIAEEAVGETLERNAKLDRWMERSGRKPNLVLDYHGRPDHPVGRCVRQGETEVQPAYDAVVVLKASRDGGFYVLTTYPECPR
jgi:hypothetical protein